MPARFADIKFNLVRAIELFEDMNHLDMDVTAPLSAPNLYKEIEVAQRLNIYLGQLIDEGIFEECELRDDPTDDEDEDEEDRYEGEEDSDAPPRSEGFDYDNGRSRSRSRSGSRSRSLEFDRGSRESFTDRFKRYIRRVIPGGRRRSDAQQDHAQAHDHHRDHDVHDHHRSRSGSRQSQTSGIRPIDSTVSSGSNDDEVYDPQGEDYDNRR